MSRYPVGIDKIFLNKIIPYFGETTGATGGRK